MCGGGLPAGGIRVFQDILLVLNEKNMNHIKKEPAFYIWEIEAVQ